MEEKKTESYSSPAAKNGDEGFFIRSPSTGWLQVPASFFLCVV